MGQLCDEVRVLISGSCPAEIIIDVQGPIVTGGLD
jgi:hypothetical protein